MVQQVRRQTTGCSASVEHGNYIISHYITDGKTISTSGEDCGQTLHVFQWHVVLGVSGFSGLTQTGWPMDVFI